MFRYGFITFKDGGVVDGILSSPAQHEVHGHILNLNRASKREQQIPAEQQGQNQDEEQMRFYKDRVIFSLTKPEFFNKA